MKNLIFRLTESVGNSTVSQRVVLSVKNYDTVDEAINAIPENMVIRDRFINPIDKNIPYIALTSVENGCVHSCINFYQ